MSNVEYGGWCPKGGWAEDAPTPPGLIVTYPRLRETPSGDPRRRTAWNVRDCDAVLALFDRRGIAISPGTGLAVAYAAECRKPCLCLDLDAPESLERAVAWVRMEAPVGDLNIVGPRESEAPGIYRASRQFIVDLLARV